MFTYTTKMRLQIIDTIQNTTSSNSDVTVNKYKTNHYSTFSRDTLPKTKKNII